MPDNIYCIFDFILNNCNSFDEMKELTKDDIDYLKTLNSNINKSELYDFVYHGLHHSQKVMLFSYLIGKHENLNKDDMKLLMDAAMYHDSGRINESEEELHGLCTAQKFDRLFTDDFYKNSENLKIVRAICEGHSREDRWKKLSFYNYELDEECYDRYSKLYDILKDADALDRARFPKSTGASIKEEFLRLDYSKSLINFSFLINKFYRNVIDTINYDYYKNLFSSDENENACFHGIGWDFAKLESILENGILSNYAASKENISISRNFEGNNSNMWISVIDNNDISKNGKAYKLFAENNIVFYSFCGKFNKGIESKSEALSNGSPIKTELYEDESFVFDRINKEDIYGFIIPKDTSKIALKDLKYLSCSSNFNVINNMVNHYYDYINETCDVKLDKEQAEKLISELKDKEIQFGKLVRAEQKNNLPDFLSDINKDVSLINDEISSWMSSSFKKYFGLDENQEPTVGMLIDDILNRKNISYEIINGEERIYKVDLKEKKKHQ